MFTPRSLLAAAALTAGLAPAAPAQPVFFDNSVGNGLWYGSGCVFTPPDTCVCDNNWSFAPVVTGDCGVGPPFPGPTHDVFIGAFVVTNDYAPNPIRSLTTSVLFINQHVLYCSATSTYNGPVHGTGGIFFGGPHVFNGPITIANGSSFSFAEGYHVINGGATVGATQVMWCEGDVTNASTFTWNQGSTLFVDGSYAPNIPGGIIRNQAGATFLAAGDDTMRGLIGLGHFYNHGSFVKNGGLGTSRIDSEFVNAPGGAVHVATGRLQLVGPQTLAGAFTLDAGATLELAGGYNTTTLGNLSSTGSGMAFLSGGFTIPAGVTASFQRFSGNGTRYGPGTLYLSVAADLAGPCLDSLTTTIAGGCQATVTQDLLVYSGQVLNYGNVSWTSGNIGAQTTTPWVTAIGGALECRGDNSLGGAGFTQGALVNLGRFGKYAGAGRTTVSAEFTNHATVEAASGQLYFEDFRQLGGVTRLMGGSIGGHYSSYPMEFDSGALTGSGDVFGYLHNDGATLAPGNSAGTIRVATGLGGPAFYRQGAAATLNLEIGGPVAGADHDLLVVEGGVEFGGTIRATLINGYAPAPGTTFDAVTWTAARAGEFATLDAPGFSIAYLPGIVRLTYVGVGPTCDPDFTCDGNADQDDVACLIDAIAGNPGCECQDLDFTRDGNVDQDDVAALINVVAGGGCP